MTRYPSKRLPVPSLLTCVLLLMVPHSASAARTASGPDIIKASGVVGGLIVHLDCDDGKLTSTLRIHDAFMIASATWGSSHAAFWRCRRMKSGKVNALRWRKKGYRKAPHSVLSSLRAPVSSLLQTGPHIDMTLCAAPWPPAPSRHRRDLHGGPTPARRAVRPLLVIDGGFANKHWFHRAFWNFKSTGARAKGNLIVCGVLTVWCGGSSPSAIRLFGASELTRLRDP